MTHSRIPRPRRCIGIKDDLHKRLRQRALDEDASIADVVERARGLRQALLDEGATCKLPTAEAFKALHDALEAQP